MQMLASRPVRKGRKNYYTIQVAANVAEVHRQTIYRAIWDGKLKADVFGMNYFVLCSNLKEWAKAREKRNEERGWRSGD